MHEAYLSALMQELESRGIPADVVGPVPREISPRWLAHALANALQASGDPAFGIAFGLRLNLASHGILGYALMSSRNGDQLLSLLSRYAHLAMPNLTLRRMVTGERVFLACDAEEGVLPRLFLTELVLTTLVAGARALFNRRIPDAQVWLDYARPPHADRYAALKVPVHFAQPHSALVCHRSFLDMEMPSANALLAEIGARQCDAMLAEMRGRTGFAQQVRRGLLHARGAFPDQEGMAARLNVSARTLRRRLGEEGVGYREIVDEVRFELAQRYLQTSELPITQIASLLAYEDPANFRRAFKRWSGVSAQTWRLEHGHRSA